MSQLKSDPVPFEPVSRSVRDDRLPDGRLAHPSSEPPREAPKGAHVDGTETMTRDELESAGIVDDNGVKIVPGQAALLVGALFIGFTVLALLGWLVVMYMMQPDARPG